MATATARQSPSHGHQRRAAFWLFVLSFGSLLILVLLYLIYTSPAVRDLGFSNPDEIRNRLAGLAALFILVSAIIYGRGHPATGAAPAAAGAPGARPPPSAQGRGPSVRSVAEDGMSRPGAPFAYEIPAVLPDLLEGGWRRYKFPAERTGGLYVDTDIVVDDMRRPSPASDTTARGRHILRMRDEVSRLCGRCDLLGHCHGAVAALLTKQDMLQNHECVPGLRKMAKLKLEQIKKAREAPAAPAEALDGGSPVADAPAAAPDASAPAPDAPPSETVPEAAKE